MRSRFNTIVSAHMILALAATAASAQAIAGRVGAVRDGIVRMSYTARPGVCGNGSSWISTRPGEHIGSFNGREWESECDSGPVRVSLSLEDGEVRAIRTYVGGRWRSGQASGTDIGMVPATEAAEYLMSLVKRGNGRASRDAILPATLADSTVVWPSLLAVAKDSTRPRDTRRQAIFWLGQMAGDNASGMLDSVASDESGERDIREQAVFALSQRPRDEGVPALIRIAKTTHDREIRKKALFWLGQSNDTRALSLFEELLTRK